MRIPALGLLVAVVTAASGCAGERDAAAGGDGGGQTVRVAVAANLKFAFEDLRTAFQKAHPGVAVTVTYGASGQFFAQLSHKAPFDLFLSADVRYPQKLVEFGLASPDAEFRYAVGRLVVWVPASSPLNLDKKGIQALLDPSVQKIALANPRHAPYGRAAEAALKKLGVYAAVKDRLVLGADVEQAAQFLHTGAADVGLIPLSLALAPALRQQGRYWLVPPEAHAPLEQSGVILSWAEDRAAAELLQAFLTGPRGRAILKRHGYDVPAEDWGRAPTSVYSLDANRDGVDWTVLGLTVRLAACTAGVLLVLGLPLAYWLATTRWRAKFLVEAVVGLPLVLPPTVLGFYLLLAAGPFSPLGQGYESVTGGRLVFSFAGVLLGSAVYNLPFAIWPFTAAFARVDRRLVEASWCLGQSRTRTFWRVVLPLAWPGILAGLILVFAHTVGEFGVVLMIGGNIPGATRTVSIAIFDDVQELNYAAAGQTSLVLVGFAFVVLCLTYALQRRMTPS